MKCAVTGWAWRTPLGVDVAATARRLVEGDGAAAPTSRHPADAFPCRWVAELAGAPSPSRHARFLRRMGGFALDVAREAAQVAAPPAAGPRLGLFFGYGGLRAHWSDMTAAFGRQDPDGARAWERGLGLLHPFWMLQHLSNNAHALCAAELDARGDGLTLAGANAGAQALAAAARALEAGAIDAAIVAAYDTLLEPETLVDLATRGGFTGGGSGAPRAPYDARAEGFVPGEAAAAVVLERPTDAAARTLMLVEAWAGAGSLDDEGAEGGDALESLLATVAAARDGRGPALGVVDGAARGATLADARERRQLAARHGLLSADTPICATLAAMGQVGAAAAVVQAIALGTALRAQRLPPVSGLERPAPGPLRPLVAPEATNAHAGLALSTGAPGLAGAVLVELP